MRKFNIHTGSVVTRLFCPCLVVIVFTGFFTPGLSLANGLTTCMTELMEQASDSTTMGELR
jgi:hypothetical protein